jgi:hypothetical protein
VIIIKAFNYDENLYEIRMKYKIFMEFFCSYAYHIDIYIYIYIYLFIHCFLPMILLLSVPNAHIHCGPPGTWNLQKLQFELKYFGKNVAEAKLDCRFNF